MFAAIVGVIGLVATVITGAVSSYEQARSREKLEAQAKENKDAQQEIAQKNSDLSIKAAKASALEARQVAGTPWILAVMKETAAKNKVKANISELAAIDSKKGVRRHYTYGQAIA